jgi:phosphoesterase RecJ-like protein
MSKVLETLDMYLDNRVAILTLFPEMLEETDTLEEDASEFINIARDIDNVEVAVFIKKKSESLYRMSLRAKKTADVRLIAEKFKGGGHIKAAGCSIEGEYSEVKAIIVKEIRAQLDGGI